MRSTQTIAELIARHMLVPGDVSEPKPEADYILSGLRAAKSVNSIARRKILNEVAMVLRCEAEDLEFLFSDFKNVVPTVLANDVELPHYRRDQVAVAE